MRTETNRGFATAVDVALDVSVSNACAAYTTLGRHLLAGEERLSVVDQGDCIVVDILSVSRGRGFGRLIFPFIGPMQRRFFRAQLDVVEASCIK